MLIAEWERGGKLCRLSSGCVSYGMEVQWLLHRCVVVAVWEQGSCGVGVQWLRCGTVVVVEGEHEGWSWNSNITIFSHKTASLTASVCLEIPSAGIQQETYQ